MSQPLLASGQVVVKGGAGILGRTVLALTANGHACSVSLHLSEESFSLRAIDQGGVWSVRKTAQLSRFGVDTARNYGAIPVDVELIQFTVVMMTKAV